MMKKTSSRLYSVCTSIPPIEAKNLLPVMIMLGLWVILRMQGVPVDPAFVVSVVMAQAYMVWRNLPVAAANLKRMKARKSRMLYWPVGLMLGLAFLQLWLSSPLFTQRMLTVLCTFFLVIMVLGILREKDLMEKVGSAIPEDGNHSAPVSLLRVNAVMAALIIGVNELLIAFESPGAWITVMPFFVLVLHGLYWAMVLLTIPDNSQDDSQHGPVCQP